MENITSQVKGNPYYVPEGVVESAGLRDRPKSFYDKEDFVEGELDIETKLTNYNDFMSQRNAIPTSKD